MKKLLLTISSFYMSLFALAQETTIWNAPSCLMLFSDAIKLERVEMQDTATMLTLYMEDVTTDKKYVDSRLFLSDSKGREYQLTGSRDMQIGRQDSLPEAGPIRFTLRFQPLPKDETVFDLRDLYERRFEIFGIHDAKRTKTAMLTAVRPESKRLPDGWETGMVTIIGRFLNYDQGHQPGVVRTDFRLFEENPEQVYTRQAWVDRDGKFTLRYLADRPSTARLEGQGSYTYYYAVPGDTLYMDIDYHNRWLRPATTRSAQGNDTHEALMKAMPVKPYYEHFFWDNRKKIGRSAFFHTIDSLQRVWEGLNYYLAGKYQLTPWECHLLQERARMTFDGYRIKYVEARQTDEKIFQQKMNQDPIGYEPLTDTEYAPYGFLCNVNIEDSTRYMATARYANIISDIVSLKPFLYIPYSSQDTYPMLQKELHRSSGGQNPELALRVIRNRRADSSASRSNVYTGLSLPDSIASAYRGKYADFVPVWPMDFAIKSARETARVTRRARDNEDLKIVFLVNSDYEDEPEMKELLRNDLQGETVVRLCDRDFGHLIEQMNIGEAQHFTVNRKGQVLRSPLYFKDIESLEQSLRSLLRKEGKR